MPHILFTNRLLLFTLLLSTTDSFSELACGTVNEAWVQTNGPGGNFLPVAMTLDSDGNVCVTGTSTDDFLTVKYSASGVQLWETRFGDTRRDLPSAIAAGGGGQVWVTGISSTNAWVGSITTLKYGADGSVIWSQRFEDPIQHPNTTGNGFVALAVDLGARFSPPGFDMARFLALSATRRWCFSPVHF